MEQSPSNRFNIPSLSTEEIDLRQLFNILWTNWAWLILGSVIGLLFGIVIALRTTPLYQSAALLQINDQESSESVLNSLSSWSRMMSKASATQVQNALMHSRYILGPVAQNLQLNLSITPHYLPFIGKSIAKLHNQEELSKPFLGLSSYAWGGESVKLGSLSLPHSMPTLPLTLIAGKNQSFKIYDASNNNLIASGKTGQRVNATSKDYQGLSVEIDSLTANPGATFSIAKIPTPYYAKMLSGQLKVSDQGDQAQKNSYLRETGVVQATFTWGKPQQAQKILNAIINTTQEKDIQKKSQQAAQALQFINSQLPKVKTDLNHSEKQLNNYRSQSNILDISAESKMMLTQLVKSQNDLEALKLEKTQLQQGFTEKHPIVIAINEKIHKQQAALSALESEAKKLPHSDQKALSLMREVKVKETLYSNLLSKIQELSVLRAGTTGDVRILDYATLPLSPLPTHKSFIVLASMFAGFTLVAIGLLASHLLLSGEMDPESIEELLGISVNAVIPFSREQQHSVKESEKNDTKIPLLRDIHSTDPAIESLRSLKTALQLHLTQASNNVIAILGPSPSVGKSFISLNFASVLAESGQRILVIDTDIRKGRCHKFIEGSRSPGLSEYLQNKASAESIIRPLTNNCDLITAGHYPKNPTELLSSPRFNELIQQARTQYNLIVLDTSPIMAVTDALIVSKQAGTNFMLVGLGKNSRKELQATIKRCQHNQIPVNGLVCNYFSKKIQSYAYSKYGYYYYSYSDKK